MLVSELVEVFRRGKDFPPFPAQVLDAFSAVIRPGSGAADEAEFRLRYETTEVDGNAAHSEFTVRVRRHHMGSMAHPYRPDEFSVLASHRWSRLVGDEWIDGADEHRIRLVFEGVAGDELVLRQIDE
jgi:hypothetical protein